MDAALMKNWNAVVTPQDEVYHLGDFAFENDPVKVVELLQRLNGRKYFIWGNHDKQMRDQRIVNEFVWQKHYYELNFNKRLYVLSHYPMLTWNGAHRGSFMLHGHCHGSVDYLNKSTTRLDVGVDSHGLFPLSIEDVDKIMAKKAYVKIDYHDRGG